MLKLSEIFEYFTRENSKNSVLAKFFSGFSYLNGPVDLSIFEWLDSSVVGIYLPISKIAQTPQLVHVLLGHCDRVFKDDVKNNFCEGWSSQRSCIS